MAKVVSQTIPSEDRKNYKRVCQKSTLIRGIAYVRKRFPWRMPKMQKGGPGVTPAQIVQRNRFIYVIDKYIPLDAVSRQRWVDANPEYKSYLFGYNFFMMEGLTGGGPVQYPQMIKTIQVVKQSVPTTGGSSFSISTIDPAKAVVLIQGNSYISDKIQRGVNSVAYNGTQNIALSPSIDPAISSVRILGSTGKMSLSEGTGDGLWGAPYVSALSASQLSVKCDMPNFSGTCYFSWEITEHKAQTVYPVLVSISANAVVIDWALVPSVAADVSITVVEYL